MDKLLPATSQNNAQTGNSNKPNNETEETFSPSSGTSADSSSSVTVAMENLSTDPDLASGAMDVDNEKDKDATTKKPDSNLHHQIKQIKPLLGKVFRAQSFTSLMADLTLDISEQTQMFFILKRMFLWRKCSIKVLVH